MNIQNAALKLPCLLIGQLNVRIPILETLVNLIVALHTLQSCGLPKCFIEITPPLNCHNLMRMKAENRLNLVY